MTELVLHRYDLSPFSEKIRLAFGYKSLAWRSVEVPIWPPRPGTAPPTADYRRSGEDALAIARSAEPEPLVSADANEIVVRHENPRTGAVHVHFPRFGYSVVGRRGKCAS